MGFRFSKPKAESSVKILSPPRPKENPENREDLALARIRKTLTQDLETFLLNNILLSVQFFNNFEREIGSLRVGPKTEHNAELANHKRHCLTTNDLYELVAKHVLFRAQHGERSHHYERLQMRRVYLVHDNIEVVQNRQSLDYSSPCYRFIIQKAHKNRPGYVKLQADESSFPEKRRVTYETIEEDEGVYTHVSSDAIHGSDASEDEGDNCILQKTELGNSVDNCMLQDSDAHKKNFNITVQHSTSEPEALHNIPKRSKSTETLSIASTTRKSCLKRHSKEFGPQNREMLKNESMFTPTERRLSGMIKAKKQGNTNILTYKRKKLPFTQSLPDLSLPTSSNHGTDKSLYSPKNSGDSSGYKSEGGSPNHKYMSPARSHASDSDYGYATITELMKPKPLAQHRLGHIPANSSEIPMECFTIQEVPIYTDPSGKNKLFDTRYYISSINFMRSFADIFSEKLSPILGFTNSLASATLQGTKIFCNVIQKGHDSKPIKVQNEIIPTILCPVWPQEAGKWISQKRQQVPTSFTWPREAMMNHIQTLGCHLLPQGYLSTKGINNEQYLEWQLAFPDVERYLETCLTHSQTRCLLFCLALYKTFLEPLNAQLGFHPTYFRTLLFSECEHNFARWPEDRPGETLYKFLSKMYDSLKERKLPDFFIKRSNMFESTPATHIAKVQEKLKRIIENPVMHLLIALRNLRYVEPSFYPVLDYKKLYKIITTDNLAVILNPNLRATIKPKLRQREEEFDEDDDDDDYDDDEENNLNLWKKFKDDDPEREWNKKARNLIDVERAAHKLTNPLSRRHSADSIDILRQPGKGAETIRKKILLEFFIEHFTEIAKQSNIFRAKRQAQFYLKHTERLVKLLKELEDGGDRMSYKYDLEIKNIRDAMETFPEDQTPTSHQYTPTTNQFTPKTHQFTPTANQFTRRRNERSTQNKDDKECKQMSNSNSSNSILNNASKNRVTVNVEIHSPTNRPSNPNITINIPDNVPQATAISVDEVVTAESTDF